MKEKYSLPLHVRLLNPLFHYCYPLYRLIYFIYKRISDKKTIELVNGELQNKTNAVVLDIGANIGFYSRFFASHPHVTRVLSFEPDINNIKRLTEETQCFSNIEIFPNAVSAHSHEKLFFVISDSSTIDHHIGNSSEQTKDSIIVESISIDDACADIPEVDIIKMDIQGAECGALCGMRKTLEKSPNILIITELWPWAFRRAGSTWQEFFMILKEYGLEAIPLEKERRLEEFCHIHENDFRKYTNIILRHVRRD